ncbi:G-protein coupled receptor GRL101-like [Scylla paramamosain]|uniref:G-protein coupled receptor GRL101-like n=1 Tax=Scylla paramamosain TaxID=85552 RepID=UPI003083E4BD
MSELHMLMTLLLCNNNITTITYGNFKGLTNLRNLDLAMNQISSIGPRGFDGLSTLPKLDLRHQYLVKIAENAFMGLTSLKILLLSHNRLTHITHPDTFAGLPSLETLLLSHNRLKTISSPNTFVGSPRLSTLVVDENPLEYVDQMLFEPLYNLTKLSTPEFRFCCLPHHAEECLPHTEEFSSCEDLMSNLVLRVFVWVVGFVALVGNTFVIVWRLMYPSGSKKNHSMLFVNLAIGDLMMGVYLLIIAGIDLKHRGVYRLHEKEWRSSPLCQFAGFLSTFSSEASVFTLTVITLDRLTILLSPYGIRRVHEGLAKRVMVGVWLVAFLLAAVPLFDVPYFKDFYGRSGVCLALHITNDKPNGWEYSVFIFIVLNLLSFMIIAISYVRIYVGARDTPLMECGRNKHGKDREMGLRVTYIVGTDAACWLPIILLGIFSLSGIKIPRKVFAWVAVFVLPFNAALNPLLYTFFTDPVRKRLKIMRESISSWRTRSTRSSVVSGVRMTSTYRGRVTTEVTDIPVPVSDGKVHTKAAICVYTPTATAATQVTHFIHDPPDHEAKKVDDRPNQNGNDAKQILDCTDPGSDAEREAIIPLETLTADRPAALRTSGRYGRKKNTADQRYD